jgi:hypothetical protein
MVLLQLQRFPCLPPFTIAKHLIPEEDSVKDVSVWSKTPSFAISLEVQYVEQILRLGEHTRIESFCIRIPESMVVSH